MKLSPSRIPVQDTRAVKPRRRPNAPSAPLYASSAWRRLVQEVIAERGRRCEAEDCASPDRGASGRVVADHIVELKDGGPELDKNNIKLLCHQCHARKTSEVKRLRSEGGACFMPTLLWRRASALVASPRELISYDRERGPVR
jgi:5-methylcytosine-specific restriction enzyme A